MNPEVEHKLRVLLVLLCRNSHDPEAWDALYGLLQPFVWNITLRILWRDPESAKDATQITFQRLSMYADFSQYSLPEQFLPYLTTIAKRVAWGILKHEASRVEAEEAVHEETLRLQGAHVERSRWLIESIIHDLDDEEKRIVVLLVEGRTVGEVAQNLGLSYTAAGVRIHRLRRALLKLMVR